jgi:hypothetical protein
MRRVAERHVLVGSLHDRERVFGVDSVLEEGDEVGPVHLACQGQGAKGGSGMSARH